MELELTGKRVLVTGSSRGIGRAIAELFAREGAQLCVCARGDAELQKTRHALASGGARVIAVQADVTDPVQAKDTVAQTIAALGGIDILVNNVGGSLGTGPFDAVEERRWREVVELNLSSAVLCSWPAVAWMKANGGGVILNMSSIFGREYGSSAAYVAAKGALIALTKEMALDLAAHSIRVNSVAPGAILFPGGSWDKRSKQDPEKVARMVERELPWKRFGRPEEVAAAAVFLCSPRANWITGACLPVDGGQGRSL